MNLHSSVLFLVMLSLCSICEAGPFKTLDFLQSISGSRIVAGQHNDQKAFHGQSTGPNYWTNKVFEITGKYPALWGGDLLFHGNTAMRWDMINEAKRQWRNGAIISIMWHVCPPNQGDSCGWEGGVINSPLNSSQWRDLLNNGGYLNQRWKQRMDKDVVPYLQDLENNGVEVLWRPLHEQNQHVFWWNSGSREDTKALYRLTHDYLSREKGLSNLIWVWDVQDIGSTKNFWDYNPGSNYFDMAALDVYGNGYNDTSFYNNLLGQAGGKPVAFGENFKLPNAQAIANQPQMSFFMTWAYGLLEDYNSPPNQTNSVDYIREVYRYSNVITLDEMPGWDSVQPGKTNIALGRPVEVSSTDANYVAANAVDGNQSSRWSSEYTDAQWIVIDLGKNYSVSGVRLYWETAFARGYEIQLSSDATSWTTVYATTNGNGGIDSIDNLQGVGRYIRLLGKQRGSEWGYSLWEFEVFGQLPETETVKLYQDCDYQGWSASFEVGSHNVNAIVAAGGKNDDASSIKVPAGYEVVLYSDDQFSGDSLVFNGNISCLFGYGFNDVVSSIIVRPISNNSSADLSIELKGNNGQAQPLPNSGDFVIQFQAVVVNKGPVEAINVRANFTLPDQTEILSMESTKGSCDSSDGSCQIESLADQQQVTITVRVKRNKKDKVIYLAQIASDTNDSLLGNNTSSKSFGGRIDVLLLVLMALLLSLRRPLVVLARI